MRQAVSLPCQAPGPINPLRRSARRGDLGQRLQRCLGSPAVHPVVETGERRKERLGIRVLVAAHAGAAEAVVRLVREAVLVADASDEALEPAGDSHLLMGLAL